MLRVLGVTIFCLLLPVCQSYSLYQEQIPNGNKVPHPCKKNYRWPGVGHNNPLGGGARNPFGEDFQAAGFKWTKELCQNDSDGDGTTNGQELGDPNCVWSSGKAPARNYYISNPGVCDPYDSPSCQEKNSFLSCTLDQFQGCDAVRKPNVTTLDLKFSETKIPAKVTTYMCMGFQLDEEADHHIIASEPLIDNRNILHHILVYACDDDYNVITTPRFCGMVSRRCLKMISAWTVGLSGQCFGPKAGYRIGPTNHKKLMLQMHYNNPFMIDNYTDASGIRLHIQPASPEVQNMATFFVGQVQLLLPPGQSRIEQHAVCSAQCSARILTQPVYVMVAANHMHYLGKSMLLELFRNGTKIANIAKDELYNYDSPVQHDHHPPLEIRPGDEIKTTCIYNTLNHDHYVTFGESTTDEMCFGFMFVYPQEAFSSSYSCESVGPLDVCSAHMRQPIAGCDWGKLEVNLGVLHGKCYPAVCTPECRDSLMHLKNDPCLSGEASTFFKQYLWEDRRGQYLLSLLNSCNLDAQNCSTPEVATTVNEGSADASVHNGATDKSNKMSAIFIAMIIYATIFSVLM